MIIDNDESTLGVAPAEMFPSNQYYDAPVVQRKRAVPLKMFVQTIWVVIDDETGSVTEHTDGGVTIPAAEWPAFYERWVQDFAKLQAAVAAS